MKVTRKDFKVRFNTPRYFKNEEKGVITCKLDYSVNVPSMINKETFYFGDEPIAMDVFDGTAVGVAKCHKDDTYNERVGSNIARTKAENRAYTQAKRAIENRVKELEFVLEAAKRFSEKTDKHNNHNLEYIERISK